METKPTGHCKGCLLEVTRVFVKIQPGSGNYLYADDHGRLWKGDVCATCQARIKRERYKSRKALQASDVTLGDKTDPKLDTES